MVDFSKLKKSSGDITRLVKEIEKLNAGSERVEDTRFWYPEVDKAGNGQATIRFLPAPEVDGDDALPWVRLFRHSFQGPTGKWYIENSLTTLKEKDPVGEYNSELWNKSTDDSSPERKQARAQKRKLEYISNVLIIKDPLNPENEGTVRLFRFGKKIFDKVMQAMKPDFDDEEPMNPFDAWTGANFKIKIRNVEGYRNYDKSEFDKPAPIGSDEEIERLWRASYSLAECVSPDKFKSYAELSARLHDVLQLGTVAVAAKASASPAASKASAVLDEKASSFDDDVDEDLSKFLNDD